MAGAHAMSQEAWTLHVSSQVLCALVFLILCLYSVRGLMEPLSSLQTAPLHVRLHWCATTNVYICFMSAMVSLFHVTDFEGSVQDMFGATAGIIKPLEYLLTCPCMMLTVVVMGGEALPLRRQGEVTGLTALVLLSGFFASLMDALIVKMMFFLTGVLFFVVLLTKLEANVRDHSAGKETLFSLKLRKGSCYKKLCVKIVLTWVMFPIWWILSAEGANIVEAPEINSIVTASLNIIAKGMYVVFVQRIHDRYIGSDSLMEPPKPKSHAVHDALLKAARLGPGGALECMAKEVKRQEEAMEHIRRLLVINDASVVSASDVKVQMDVEHFLKTNDDAAMMPLPKSELVPSESTEANSGGSTAPATTAPSEATTPAFGSEGRQVSSKPVDIDDGCVMAPI